MRRQTTEITERHGGVHSQRALARARAMLIDHGFTRPRLYHIILLDHASESPTSVRRFQGAIKALCRKLRQDGIPARWRACIERDDEKGLHCHLFVLVDASSKNPCAIINPKRNGPQAWLHTMLATRFMNFHLAQPKADMHRVGSTIEGKRKNYATLAGDKLTDCEIWISYLVKRRSKPGDMRTVYLSSRDSKHKRGPAIADQSSTGQAILQKEIRVDQYQVVDARDDAGNANAWARERDDEQPVELWDERTGEMTKLPKKRPNARAQADAMVAAALQRSRSSADELTN